MANYFKVKHTNYDHPPSKIVTQPKYKSTTNDLSFGKSCLNSCKMQRM